ncbi:MAG: hypothetical protein JWR42_1550 [Marmoricola sp.]|nr:hypothetical protein [Marmoricola sp.]
MHRLAVLLVGVLLGVGSAGCGPGSTEATGTAAPRASATAPVRIGPQRARAVEQRILAQRVEAVRTRDLGLFLRRVDRRDPELVARQTRYFRNLVQLPLARLDYQVLDTTWRVRPPARWGRDVRVPQVNLTMQLQGFDATPVRRTVGFAFDFGHGPARIVSDRAPDGRALFSGAPAPWDLTAITVRRAPGVLGIFDARTVASAPDVLAAVRRGIDAVGRIVPYPWSRQVVVYSVKDSDVLDSFTDVPGGALDHLGAIAFPTYARDGGSVVASTRMLMMPSSVQAGEPFLGRITRHELTHVALGPRDDGTPAWVSEGIAEYVGARDLATEQRIIPTSALAQATRVQGSRDGRGAAAGMPATTDFNGPEQEWHYALSWMAFDHIAATAGEPRVWQLVSAMHEVGPSLDARGQDRVLERVLGYDGAELARRAADRIRAIYG